MFTSPITGDFGERNRRVLCLRGGGERCGFRFGDAGLLVAARGGGRWRGNGTSRVSDLENFRVDGGEEMGSVFGST